MGYRGNRCQVCTGCGRCAPGGNLEKKIQVVTASFQLPEQAAGERRSDGAEEAAGPYAGHELAIADLGTTTIAMEWYDGCGVKQGEYVCANPQRIFGADVISRIQAAENPMLRRQMQQLVRRSLTEGLTCFRQQGGRPEKLVIAGNTTMLYLLTGHDPSPLGTAPFTADYLDQEQLALEGVEAVTLPGLSAFVGGDIVAGIVACGMDRSEEVTLLVDLGTNGELALGCRDRVICCGTAAGPAFEGGSDIWGADMVALTAKLLKLGLVDETGLLAEPYFEQGITISDMRITQAQIRQFQMAKAAICTGIHILAEVYGLTELRQIQKVYLAGGFGYFLDAEAAMVLGLLPQELSGRVSAAGNTALAGAWLYAVNPEIPERVAELRHRAQVINLAEQEAFGEKYIENMNLCKFVEKDTD
ncbi:MAG: ASKHA domain-containing protein [Acetatifactor sp.]|nr:ASKHA domain-containing protein [Acetatifactor sp.]